MLIRPATNPYSRLYRTDLQTSRDGAEVEVQEHRATGWRVVFNDDDDVTGHARYVFDHLAQSAPSPDIERGSAEWDRACRAGALQLNLAAPWIKHDGFADAVRAVTAVASDGTDDEVAFGCLALRHCEAFALQSPATLDTLLLRAETITDEDLRDSAKASLMSTVVPHPYSRAPGTASPAHVERLNQAQAADAAYSDAARRFFGEAAAHLQWVIDLLLTEDAVEDDR